MSVSLGVGSIYAKLLLDKQAFTAGMNAAKAEAAQAGTQIGRSLDTVTAAEKRAAAGADDAGRRLHDLSGKLDAAHAAASRLSTGLLMVSTAGAAGLAAVAKQAMDAVESENLFTVSLGKNADGVRAWSKELRASLGLNEYELRKQTGMWFTMLNSIGLTERASLGMSKGMVQLAYDMASFYNIKPDLAFEKLRAGIMGEIEPLRQLGIVVDENTVKTYLSAHGIDKKVDSLSQAEKAEIRYKLILEQTTKAQGDLARTIDSPANKLRRLGEEAKQTAVEFGTALLPAADKLLTGAQRLTHGFASLSDGQKNLLAQGALWTVFAGVAVGAMGRIIVSSAETVKAIGEIRAALVALEATSKGGLLARLLGGGVGTGTLAAAGVAGLATFGAVGAAASAATRRDRMKAEAGLPPDVARLWDTYNAHHYDAQGTAAWSELARRGYDMRSGVPVLRSTALHPEFVGTQVMPSGTPAPAKPAGPKAVNQELLDRIAAAHADRTETLTDDLAVAKRNAEHLRQRMESLRAKGGEEFGKAALAYEEAMKAVSTLNRQIAAQGKKAEAAAKKSLVDSFRDELAGKFNNLDALRARIKEQEGLQNWGEAKRLRGVEAGWAAGLRQWLSGYVRATSEGPAGRTRPASTAGLTLGTGELPMVPDEDLAGLPAAARRQIAALAGKGLTRLTTDTAKAAQETTAEAKRVLEIRQQDAMAVAEANGNLVRQLEIARKIRSEAEAAFAKARAAGATGEEYAKGESAVTRAKVKEQELVGKIWDAAARSWASMGVLTKSSADSVSVWTERLRERYARVPRSFNSYAESASGVESGVEAAYARRRAMERSLSTGFGYSARALAESAGGPAEWMRHQKDLSEKALRAWQETWGRAGDVIFDLGRDQDAMKRYVKGFSAELAHANWSRLWLEMTGKGPDGKRSPMAGIGAQVTEWGVSALGALGVRLRTPQDSRRAGAVANALPAVIGAGVDIAGAQNKGQAGIQGAMDLASAGMLVGANWGKSAGIIGMAAGAVIGGIGGLLFGGDAEAKRQREEQKRIEEETLNQIRGLRNDLSPVSDYFRNNGGFLLAPSSAQFAPDDLAGSAVALTSRGLRTV